MAKKQIKEKIPPALELKTILGAIDLKAIDLWDQLNDEEKKCINFFTLNRFISSVSSSNKREIQEHFVLAVNEIYNKNYFTITDHPKLLWLLLCHCAHQDRKILFHEFIKLQKNDNKKLKFLKTIFPNRKIVDLETLSNINSDKDLKELGKNYGMSDKELSEYF